MSKPSINDPRLGQSEGYYNAYEYWAALSGLTTGSIVDHASYFLTSAGYVGTLDDMFNAWLADTGGITGGTPTDNYLASLGIGFTEEMLQDVEGNDLADVDNALFEVLA